MNQKATPALIEASAVSRSPPADRSGLTPPALPTECCKAEDLIRQQCPPPLVRGQRADLATTLSTINRQREEDRRNQRAHGKRDSASWLSSLVLHGVLIALLALLLAPADFGGIQTHLLYLSFSDEDHDEQAQFELAAEEPEPEPEPMPAAPPPPDVAAPADDALASADSSGADSGELVGDAGGAAQQAAPRGSFFGIEANGHDFVYVLDMSGSMEGRRFKRATAELVRSVSGLRESQNFYVLLFNGSTVQMYNESSLQPTPIPATNKNKEKLVRWLKTAFRGGSTDPREALRIALRMNPSAIFMLSDGEFDDQKKGRKRNILGGDTDAFSIVAAASGKVPIHAVAFEDPNSCANMKRLSEMTNGEYRFSEKRSAIAAQQTLTQARDALVRGDTATAEFLMREIVETHGQTEAGWKARKELANLLSYFAERSMNEGNFAGVKESLMGIVQNDPNAVVTADLQQRLVLELVRRSQSDSDQQDQITEVLTAIAGRFPKSKTAQSIRAPVANGHLKNARALIAGNDLVGAIKGLELVLSRYPQTLAAEDCQRELQKIAETLMAEADQRRRISDVAYVRHLRALVGKYKSTYVAGLAGKALEELAIDMVCKARDANLQRDMVLRNQTNKQLREGFGDDPILRKVRVDLSRNELKAREWFREGTRLEKRTRAGALRQYQKIVESCGNTLAAKRAQERLRILQAGEFVHDEEFSELVEMTR